MLVNQPNRIFILGDWYSWEHTSLARLSQEFESPILHQQFAPMAQLVAQLISNQ